MGGMDAMVNKSEIHLHYKCGLCSETSVVTPAMMDEIGGPICPETGDDMLYVGWSLPEKKVNLEDSEDESATVTPWSNGWAVGFRYEFPDREPRFIYLNPSMGETSVFLYTGTEGDPADDSPHHYYEM